MSLVVKWLRLCSQCKGPGFNPWSGNQISHATSESCSSVSSPSTLSFHSDSPLLAPVLILPLKLRCVLDPLFLLNTISLIHFTGYTQNHPSIHIVLPHFLVHAHSVTKLCQTLLQPHGLQPIRLLCLRDIPDKNIGMGCPFLPQGAFPIQGSNPSLSHFPPWQADSLPL